MKGGIMILDTNIVHTPSVLDSLAYRTSQSICDALGIEMGIVRRNVR